MTDPNPQMKALADRMVSAVREFVARAITKRDADTDKALAELTHRADRHAEHLRGLEGRMKKLEGK